MTAPTDTDLAQALLPCPFCGSKNVVHVTADHPKHAHYVLCMMCDSPSAMRDTSAHAAESWNRRDHESRAQPPRKPDECANGCPPFQVCDYCHGPKGEDERAQPASVPIGGVRGQPIVTTEMCEAAFVALRKEVIDGRNPMHPDEAALIHDAIAAAINAAPENSSSQIPQATGSFNCPICGEAYSHQHSGEEIVEFRRRSERHDERALAFRQAALLLRREAQALEDSGSSIHTKNTYLRYAAYLKDNDFRNRDCIPLIVASQMRAALDECIEWLGPYKAQLATDFKGYEQHSDAGRVLDAIMHAQSAVNAYLAAAPQPAKGDENGK